MPVAFVGIVFFVVVVVVGCGVVLYGTVLAVVVVISHAVVAVV
jgi:hypothetical protein